MIKVYQCSYIGDDQERLWRFERDPRGSHWAREYQQPYRATGVEKWEVLSALICDYGFCWLPEIEIVEVSQNRFFGA
jgi:hypothetical protein